MNSFSALDSNYRRGRCLSHIDTEGYTASIGESIYVIHAFQKKSKVGIATPKPEMDLIRRRLKQLRGEVKSAEKRGS